MAMDPLDPGMETKTERELNRIEDAPEEITRYIYNGKDIQGIRFAESPMSIIGGIKYIREDLVTRKPINE